MRSVGDRRPIKAARLPARIFARRTVPAASVVPDHRVTGPPGVARLKALLIAPFVNLREQVLRRIVVPAGDTDRMGWIDEKGDSRPLSRCRLTMGCACKGMS